jgi:hypothetical protein
LLTCLEGLGRYLTSIDRESRPWWWQLQNIVVFCQDLFLQGISTTVGNIEDEDSSIQGRMRSLLSCTSKEDYNTLCDLLIGKLLHYTRYDSILNSLAENEIPSVADWVRHKRHPVTASGLNKYCSLMDQHDWDTLSKTASAVEQPAQEPYLYGTRPSLSAAIQMYNTIWTGCERVANLCRASSLDARDKQQYTAQEEQGATSITARYRQSLSRDGRSIL